MTTETDARTTREMEFGVRKSDLLEEILLTQGVAERKTTISILWNLLCEARGNRQLGATSSPVTKSL
jgi:DNA polymerase III sliding clamp (beta) subunit (PCNA family)